MGYCMGDVTEIMIQPHPLLIAVGETGFIVSRGYSQAVLNIQFCVFGSPKCMMN